MKKFKYSKLSFFCIVFLSMLGIKFIVHGLTFKHNDIMIPFVYLIMMAPFIGEYMNRFVEFKDEHVIFNSFRIDKKVRSYTIRYEDILSLESVKIPLLGFYKVKVKAKNVPYAISVTWCMRNHNKLFYELYIHAKQSNPNVYIDNRLIEYFEKKNYFVF
ncbi:MAG: hypothetical protein U0L11_02620 [Acutalibacteraceae bacterium]|nr:hypothetical protein [Acutalibacteraceae bacterium]